MKYIYILYLFLAALLMNCSNSDKTNKGQEKGADEKSEETPVMEFKNVYHDFGKIKRGEKVSCAFTFENTGSANLIIKDAAASCGCTVPKYNEEPIQPGDKGSVEIVFDSEGFRGVQYKEVILKTNTPYGEKTLTIKANVVP